MQLRLNPELEIQVSQITDEHRCVVIDDFLLNPQEAVKFACANAGEFIRLERSYPGIVLPVDNALLAAMNRFIQRDMSRLFPFCRGGINFHTQFSLATLQPDEFTWIQRLCHSDPRLEPGRVNYAALLYLFEKPEMGGTAFYRWKDKEFWQDMSVRQRDDPNAGLDLLEEKFQMFRDPPCYMTESNEAAELLNMVPAKFNRLVFYSGDLPHSAYIEDPALLVADPTEGRLTLNCFVSAIPK
ncbi:DUF6445 family protein [Pseudomonadota bacterium]